MSQHEPWRIAHWPCGQTLGRHNILHICRAELGHMRARAGTRPKPGSTCKPPLRRGGPSFSCPSLYSPLSLAFLAPALQSSRVILVPSDFFGSIHGRTHPFLSGAIAAQCTKPHAEPPPQQLTSSEPPEPPTRPPGRPPFSPLIGWHFVSQQRPWRMAH